MSNVKTFWAPPRIQALIRAEQARLEVDNWSAGPVTMGAAIRSLIIRGSQEKAPANPVKDEAGASTTLDERIIYPPNGEDET